MKKKWGKISALLLTGFLLFPSQSYADWDDWGDWEESDWRKPNFNGSNYYDFVQKRQNDYERKMLINGRYDGEAYLYNQTWYIPIDDLIENIGGYYFYNWQTGLCTIQWNGNDISVTNQSNQVLINKQNMRLSKNALLLDDGWLDYDYDADDLYVPIDFVQQVLKGTATLQTRGAHSVLAINISQKNQDIYEQPVNEQPIEPIIPPITPDNNSDTDGHTNLVQDTPPVQNLSLISGKNIYTALRTQNGWKDLSYHEGEYQPYQLKDEIISYEIKRKAQHTFIEIEIDNQFNRYTNYYGRTNLSKLLTAATNHTTATQLLTIADELLKSGEHSQLRKRLTLGEYVAYVYLEPSRKGNEVKIYLGNQNFTLFR